MSSPSQSIARKGIGSVIAEHISLFLQAQKGASLKGCDLHSTIICEVEKAVLQEVLRFSKYNQMKAAQILGINRNTLKRKLMLYGIPLKKESN